MIGLVLCGGKALRLPHKLFLTMKNGEPLYTSAMDTVLSYGMEPVLAIPRNREAIFKTLNQYFFPGENIRLVFDDYGGLPALLKTMNTKEDDLAVFCGDNIYPRKWLSQVETGTAYVRARQATDVELDGYQLKEQEWKWVHRTEPITFSLLTPWIFDRRTVISGNSLIEILNTAHIFPYVTEDQGWLDLGTEAALERYYASP